MRAKHLIAVSALAVACAGLGHLSGRMSAPAFAQSKSKAKEGAMDPEKVKAIRKLMEVTGAGQLGVQAMGQMMNIFKQQMPSVPQKFWDDFAKEVNPDDLVRMTIPIYDRHLSLPELNDAIRFYETPSGRKLIQAMPQITAESMQAGQQWGAEIGARIQKRLQEQGTHKGSAK